MPSIPDLDEIRAAFREVNEASEDQLAARLIAAVAKASPTTFNRPYLPHAHAAAYLDVSAAQLKKLRWAGLIAPAFVDGRVYFYSRDALDAYAAGQAGKLNS